jgi:hypothetical protein
VIVDMPSDNKCPIIFGRSFVNTIGAKIDCSQETISLKFGEEMKFQFSKFKDKPNQKEFEEQEEGEENVDLTYIHLVTQLENKKR